MAPSHCCPSPLSQHPPPTSFPSLLLERAWLVRHWEMGTEVAAEIPLEKRNLLRSRQNHFVSIFCQSQMSWYCVGFDAVVTDPAEVGFNLVGPDLIFLLHLFKKWHLLWLWPLVSSPPLHDPPFLCLTSWFLKLFMAVSVLSPVFSLSAYPGRECLCRGVPSLTWQQRSCWRKAVCPLNSRLSHPTPYSVSPPGCHRPLKAQLSSFSQHLVLQLALKLWLEPLSGSSVRNPTIILDSLSLATIN